MTDPNQNATRLRRVLRPAGFVLCGFVRILRRRPYTSLFVVPLLLAGTALGLYLWSGARLRAADRACREFRRDEAERHLRAAAPFRKWWDPDVPFLAARLARMGARYPEAAEHLKACQKMEGSSARVQLEWVLLRALQGDIDEVEPGLWNCVQNGDPDSAFILEVMAGMNMRALQFPRAAATLDRWVEVDPNNAQAWEWRGWVLDRLHRADEAEVCFRRSLELDPSREQTRYWLAELYLARFKVEEATPLIEGLLTEQPNAVRILSAAGQLRFLSGRVDEARQLFDRAYALDPNDQDLLIRRAKLELQSGRLPNAEVWLRRALALEEGNSEVHYLLHQAIGGQPGREKDAAAQLAVYEKYRGQAERFSRLLRELIPANPHDPKYAAELGDILFRTKQPSKAAYWHLRALTIDPGYIPSHRALADYYEKAGRPKEAAEHRRRLSPATTPAARP
jgi:predicted Zn-dependent protease